VWKKIQECNPIWFFGFDDTIVENLAKQNSSAYYSMVAFDKMNVKFFPIFDFTTEFNSERQIVRYLNFAKFN
jgi:hypothetical protein